VRKPLRILLRVVAVLVALVLAAGGWLWWKLRPRVDPIPAVLAAVDPNADLAKITIGGGGIADFVLGDQRGHVTYLMIDSKESLKAHEGRTLADALDRWITPDTLAGFSIGDAEGLGVLRFKIDDIVKQIRRETRLPLYVDYDGKIIHTFKLPKGHTGLVVLGPDLSVVYRHSGPMKDDDLGTLRDLLGAKEPPPPPPAPPFQVGPLTTESCRGKACAIVILAGQVEKKRVPWIKGGFKGSDDEATRLMEDPSTRLVGALYDMKPGADAARGVVVGDTDALPDGWERADDGDAARRTFDVPPGEAALVVIDALGRVAFKQIGRIPLYKFGPIADLLHAKRE
jgi:hypothetical protein